MLFRMNIGGDRMTNIVRVLIVDDDPGVCKVLRQYCEDAGFAAEEAHDIAGARLKLAEQSFDLVFLDLYFGDDAAGCDLAREIRQHNNCGIITISGRADRDERMELMFETVDDTIAKPLEPNEVIARAQAVLRRYGFAAGQDKKSNGANIAKFAGWTLNLKRHELTSPEGKSVSLTMGEFNLLCNLVRHPNEVLSREQIIEMDSSMQTISTPDRAVDMRVSRLRQRLSQDMADDTAELIRTVRGAGYLFAAEVVWSNGE